MRALIVHPHMTVYGGAETVVHRLSECLTGMGVANSVVTLTLSDEVKRICDGMDFILPQKGRYEFKIRSTGAVAAAGIIREIKGLNSLIRKHAKGYDVINAHNFPSTWAALGSGRPVVWMCNEPPELWNNPAPAFALRAMYLAGRGADKYVVNRGVKKICVADEFNRTRISERYGISARIIPYGIESRLFWEGDARKARQRYALGGSFVALQSGMITPQKNQMESLIALNAVKGSIKDIRLVFAGMGGGAYEDGLRRYIKDNGLEKYVVFTGHIRKEELKDLYHACDVAVFPVKTQGGWLAPFEVLSAGRPVVISTAMGAAGLMRREGLGVVTDRFAEAITEVYMERHKHLDKALRSRRWISENLTWKRFTEGMVEVFHSVKSC